MRNSRLPPCATPPRAGRLRAGALAAMLSLLLATGAALADDKTDHDRAREAVRSGQVLPLRSVLQKLQASQPGQALGQVLEVELERKGERWVYEIKLLQADGTLRKLYLDARTAEVLRSRERRESHDWREPNDKTAEK